MRYLKRINELHQDTIESYRDKRLYNYLKDNYPNHLNQDEISSIDLHDILILACNEGDLDLVKILLDDPRVDPSDYYNYAINWASFYSYEKITKLLAKDFRIQDSLDLSEKEILDKYL